MSAAASAYDLLRPIEGDDACGPSLRYETIYDRIRQSRRQDLGGAVIEGVAKVADHKTAVSLISGALATQSKDLQLAVWLTDSLIHREGFAGLQRGLDLICSLIETFWDKIHPQPDDPGDYEARAAVLEWLAAEPKVAKETCPVVSVRFVPITENGLTWVDYEEKSRKDAPKSKAEAFESAVVITSKAFYRQRDTELTDCRESIQKLGEICDQRFGKDGPGFSGLSRTLEELQTIIKGLLNRKLESEPDPPEATQVEEPAPADIASIVPDIVTGARQDFTQDLGEIEPRQPADAAGRILAAARFLRRTDAANPVGYLIVRAYRWGELRAGGTDLQPSLLAAPATDVRTTLRRSAAAGRWAEVLDTAETAAETEAGRGWLDLHRYSVLACEKLGYASVARAIRSELACLLTDFPQLTTATLLDDTGSANPETAAWLATVRKKD